MNTDYGQEELDLKAFMDQHAIQPWRTANDRIETALRLAGLTVLLVERSLQGNRWRVCFIRQEPDFFQPDAETGERLVRVFVRHGIEVHPRDIMLKKTSFRLEASFTWAEGEPGRGVSFGFAKRGRLVEYREEYTVDSTGRAMPYDGPQTHP